MNCCGYLNACILAGLSIQIEKAEEAKKAKDAEDVKDAEDAEDAEEAERQNGRMAERDI